MREQYTAGAQRLLERAETRARHRASSSVEARDLIAAMADEPEGRAGEMLLSFGLQSHALYQSLDIVDADAFVPLPDDPIHPLPRSPDFTEVLRNAKNTARQWDRSTPVASEHFLKGLLDQSGPNLDLLAKAGVRLTDLHRHLDAMILEDLGPIPLDQEPPALVLRQPGEDADLSRIFDAASNRVREGLRVIEDYVRFVLNDAALTARLKDVRHRFGEIQRSFSSESLIAARDTPGDVGTHIMTVEEQFRENPRSVLLANFKRVTEALRSLEEYGKLKNVWISGRLEVLRYDSYTLEKLVLNAVSARNTLRGKRLYVLVSGQRTYKDLAWVVGEVLEGGAQVVQLREKGVTDREWLKRAEEVRRLTRNAGAIFLVNDRVDLAIASGADGVHLGQTDLPIQDARRILGASAILGLSTHNTAQIEAAILEAVGYFAVGPVFASNTKSFAPEELVGLEPVRHAARTTTLPWYAVGGVTPLNLDGVIEAGAEGVVVGASVTQADFPRRAAAEFRRRLDAIPSPRSTL